jgi:hypothetical protein
MPMTADSLVATIAEYERILERARKIVNTCPFWAYTNDDFARLSIDGDNATVEWPSADSSWDSCIVERNAMSFPAALLLLDGAALDVWQADQRAEYERRREEENEANLRRALERERETYLALKRKYEGS